MWVRKAALTGVFVFHALPALAMDDFSAKSKHRSITAFSLAGKQIEMRAVSRKSRADTYLRRQYDEDCRAMAKVLPGFPQPAIVTVDFRLHF